MTNPSFTVLIIDNDTKIRNLLRLSLANYGYCLEEAENGEDGLLKAAIYRPDLLILNLDLPQLDGLTFIKRLRQWSDIPIIALSACGQESAKIEALDAGVDDYLTKPLSIDELLAHLRATLRRTLHIPHAMTDRVFHIGNLHIDMVQRQVWVGEHEIHLTPIEYKLLTILAQHAGTTLTHRHLLGAVWGPDYVQAKQYLRVYIAGLRRKLEANPARPRYLHTESTIGYRLAANSETALLSDAASAHHG